MFKWLASVTSQRVSYKHQRDKTPFSHQDEERDELGEANLSKMKPDFYSLELCYTELRRQTVITLATAQKKKDRGQESSQLSSTRAAGSTGHFCHLETELLTERRAKIQPARIEIRGIFTWTCFSQFHFKWVTVWRTNISTWVHFSRILSLYVCSSTSVRWLEEALAGASLWKWCFDRESSTFTISKNLQFHAGLKMSL